MLLCTYFKHERTANKKCRSHTEKITGKSFDSKDFNTPTNITGNAKLSVSNQHEQLKSDKQCLIDVQKFILISQAELFATLSRANLENEVSSLWQDLCKHLADYHEELKQGEDSAQKIRD